MNDYKNEILLCAYQQMYWSLADAVSRAIEALSEGESAVAVQLLWRAQQEAEDVYTHAAEHACAGPAR